MCFVAIRLSGAELAQGDSLAVIGASTTSIDKGRVETMHIKVIIVDEEAFTYCSVSIVKCVNVEPNINRKHRWVRRVNQGEWVLKRLTRAHLAKSRSFSTR